MELKYQSQMLIHCLLLALIVPYGIEIHPSPELDGKDIIALIVPYGIEIMEVKEA